MQKNILERNENDDEKGKLKIIFHCDICGKDIDIFKEDYEQIFYFEKDILVNGKTYCINCYNKQIKQTQGAG